MVSQKKSGKKEEFGFRKGFIALIFILEVILVFTFFDYMIHSLDSNLSVPHHYFTTKIVYSTLVGFITYLFIRNKPIIKKSAILATVISIILLIRYILENHSISFSLLFFAIHFVILFIVTYVGCKITRM